MVLNMDENLNKQSLDTSIEFTPQNPFTMDIPKTKDNAPEDIAYPGYEVQPETTGVLETALQEFKQTSTEFKIAHALNKPLTQPADLETQYFLPNVNDKFYQPAPPGWTPKQELEKQTNVDPKFIPRLLESQTPADFQYRLNDSIAEQKQDSELQNGSTMGKILGGGLGLTLGSIENFIPLTAAVSKAKVASGFLDATLKNTPSVLAASAIHEGANQMDSENKSMTEFLKNTFIDTAFGVTFMGGLGAGKSLLNLSELNKLKSFARENLDGIGFNYKVNEKGDVEGFQAVDTTGGSLSAAKVSKAQEMADAAFYKGGIFKVPYVGSAVLAGISGNIPGLQYFSGSPLVQLLTSKYGSARQFANAAFDHFITTVGEMKGGVREKSFETSVKQTRAMLTALQAQTIALHAERNGYDLKSRPAIGIANAWSAFKQKSIEALSQQTKATDYVSKDAFHDEIQNVLYNGESSPHAAVNEAAKLYRNVIDSTYKDFRDAHNLPENWLPPRTAASYLMRVYDTKYLSSHDGEQSWIENISKWLKDSDEVINTSMKPINDLDAQIKDFEAKHTKAVEILGQHQKLTGNELVPFNNEAANNLKINDLSQPNDMEIAHSISLDKMRRRLKDMKEKLQNDLRNDHELNIHVDDVNDLSAEEAKELKGYLKPVNDLKKQVKDQEKVIADLKSKTSKALSSAKKKPTLEAAKPKAEAYVDTKEAIAQEEEKLRYIQNRLYDAESHIQDLAKDGKINPRFYKKDHESLSFEFKDPNKRLKFRDTYESDFHRKQAAKGYLNSILNMHPQDIVADTFGRLTGKPSENVLKSRTLLVPDNVLYNNNFMTKDVFAKTANYVNYLSRRTHLKNSFKNVTVNGDHEELAEGLLDEFNANKSAISEKITKLEDSLSKAKTPAKKAEIQKSLDKAKKEFSNEKRDFEKAKNNIKYLYENRMMGLGKRNDFENSMRRMWMSLTAATNLHNLPATQLTDLAFGAFQHGIWPFVRDAIAPILESCGGILKTKDAEALREMAPHVNLGYQDVGNNYADRNWSSELQPYINMGKIVNGVEKFAHFSAVTDLSTYIDNGVQRAHGSVIQSRFMELLHKQLDGTLSNKDSLYLRKYGIDPKIWAERMVKAYKDSDGFKTKLGGYMSKSWQWQDVEAANVFNDAVFRGIQNTLVWKGMADSPFFADNLLGLFFHTFTGWGYASTNRYLIPSLQHPDGELLLKMLWMMSAGSLVSPMRRIARGESPVPDDMTDTQRAYESFSDSGVMSIMSNLLNVANLMTNDKLLGDLKNDKFRNRTRTGIFGMSDIVSSTASRIGDVMGMVNSGIDEKDIKTLAHMLPISGAMYGRYAGDKLIESWDLPRNKRAAENQ
jgi:hypothetical protein